MGELTYTVQIEPAEEGGFVASVPALPGCHTQGETLEETVANLREAIEGFLVGLAKRGKKIPVEHESKQPLVMSIDVRPPLHA